MSKQAISNRHTSVVDEEEIFKTLSHRIRRDIIKAVGNEGKLSFSEIQNKLESVDSPNLSYHLKSMQPLITQKDNKYELSEIGEAAFLLLSRTDQSVKITKYRRNFLYAYIITVACWLTAQTLIPWLLGSHVDWSIYMYVHIIITIISCINFVIIWQLRKRYI